MSAINYAKWDKIELSDDEDFECHPNVDKKSFIKWKQQDIHRQREERRQNIKDLTQEIEINSILLERIQLLSTSVNLTSLSSLSRTVDQLRARGQEPDAPRPKSDAPAYDTMIAALLAQIQTELTAENIPEDDSEEVTRAFSKRLEEHKKKLSLQQEKSTAELKRLKHEEESKLTMDTMCKPGFDKTSVNKTKVEPPPPVKPSSAKKKETTIEVLNPDSANKNHSVQNQDDEEQENEDILTSEIAREFSKLRDFPKSFEFITKHPYIVSETKSDEILAAAFESQMKGKSKTAKQCVHQALVLKYCAQLGKDGVSLFFRRMSTHGKPLSVFTKDVEDTYTHIKNRCAILKSEQESKQSEPVERETIQLYTPDPNKPIQFRIPTEDTDPEGFAIFNSFPQDFREALVTKQLEQVNKVLDKMEYSVAEDLVEKLGQAQILCIEPEIRDAAEMKKLEEEARRDMELEENEKEKEEKDINIEK